MNTLVNELIEAIEDYGREFDGPGDVIWYVMAWTGGGDRYPPVGKVPPPPDGVEDKRSIGDVWGHHTIDQVHDWLDTLVSQGMWEHFLVTSIIRAMEAEFDYFLNTYGVGAEKRRALADDMEAKRQDPEYMAEFRAELERQGADPGPEGSELVSLIAKMREPASLSELKERQDRLTTWQRLTQPLLERERSNDGFRKRHPSSSVAAVPAR